MKNVRLISFAFIALCFSLFANAGPVVTAEWGVPNTYVDGSPLDKTIIGGYAIEYKKVGDTVVNKLVLPGADRTRHEFELPTAEVYEIRVLTYDINGNVSDWTGYTFDAVTKTITQTYLSVTSKTVNHSATCTQEVNCKIVP